MKLVAALLLTIAICQQAPAQTLDANGWTLLTPSADSRLIYVSSSSGLDTNSGLTEATPLKTIRFARSKIRSGFADWMLLKCGDTFTEGTVSWELPGR